MIFNVYLFFKLQLKWSKSMDYCRSMGMQLVSIDSEEENSLIRDKITSMGKLQFKSN